jgi:HEPN domain-containing protein
MSAIQEQIHRDKRNGFIERSFRDTADRDYISARLCHRHKLTEQFLWASQQAVEKYLKGILLFHDENTIGLSHNLNTAFKKAQQIEALGLTITQPCIEFMDYLNSQGPNRYFVVPRSTPGKELLSLDDLVWQLRRFCDDYFFPHDDARLVMRSERRLAFVTSERCVQNPANLRLEKRGFLEQILDTDKHLGLRADLT